MNYYEISLIGFLLDALTYQSEDEFHQNDIVCVKLRNKNALGVIQKSVCKPPFKTQQILSKSALKFTQIQLELANFISYYYVCKKSVVYGIFEPYEYFENTARIFEKCPKLNEIQTKAFEFTQKNPVSLIFGDTGCGKSEIYIRAIFDALNDGKNALFLMPEISLTPQMQTRLERYFGTSVGIWHSKISKKTRAQIIQKLQSGEIKLIAGARSALFLPFNNLSLIIVDEEHDDSYKSSQNPHYNARDLAIYLSKFNIKVILGSATPAISTLYKQPNFRIKGTFFKSKKEFIYDENENYVSEKILCEIDECLKNDKQAIIFLPTRANFKYMRCKNCFHTIKCQHCSVSMSFHRNLNALKCHYCGKISPIPTICPNCQSQMLQTQKIGTSEVLNILREKFQDAKIAKFDRDEITTQSKLEKLLSHFNDRKIDILVGTQMLSKGHDYHNVELAVILGLDEYLDYPDFRAYEKTLSLAMQVSGRAGRANFGKILIQTQKREFFENFIQNYDAFYKNEISLRNPLYPPFARLLRINISNKSEAVCLKILQDCVEILAQICAKNSDIEIVGYGKSGIEKIALKFRYNILLRSTSHLLLIKAANLIQRFDIDIDMDAINFN